MVVADSPSAEPRPVRARGRPGFLRLRVGRSRGAVGPQFPGPCAGSRLTPPFVKSSPHARFKVGSAAGPQSPRSGRPRPAARRRAAPRAPPSIRRGAAPAPAAAPLPALSYDLEFLVGGRDTLRAAGPLGSAPFSRPGLGRATSRARASRPGPASRSGAHRGGSGALRTVSAGCTPNRAESSSLLVSRVRNAVTAASRRRSR